MIVAEQKKIDEIAESLAPYKRVVIASCGTCVTVCLAGGEKEALKLQGLLKTERPELECTVVNCKRQCDHEFIDEQIEDLQNGDVVLSLACGVGVQFLSEKIPKHLIMPGLNTQFYGASKALGHWAEYCQGCGNCLWKKPAAYAP